MLDITSFSKCTFAEALHVWNRGFEGYFADVTLTMDDFLARFGRENLSPELSLVAWIHEEPVGLILSGVRNIDGKRIAWNGGTGVVPEYRRQGIGRKMMNACLDVYRNYDIDIAYLEAIVQNTSAIALYEQAGYHVQDHVTSYTRMGSLSTKAFDSAGLREYTVVIGPPYEAARISFYRKFSPWQTQWPSVLGGQSVILYDKSGHPAAYALYKCRVNDAGEIRSIALYQCEVKPDTADVKGTIRHLLREIYSPCDVDCRQLAVNIPRTNAEVERVLAEAGFTASVEQVLMSHKIKG